SRTPMDPGSWPTRTGPGPLALVKYSMTFMRSLGPLGGPEVSQQAVERALIGIVILPAGEIADVPRPFDLRGPSYRAFQDGVIEPDREEHDPFLPPLPVQRGFDFRFHPIAGEGLLREHEHELVVHADRRVDALAELLADLEVFRGKPATDALGLEIGVQAFGEASVLGAVAYFPQIAM